MRNYARKVYGNSKEVHCPFCQRLATQKNEQGVEVCHLHLKSVMEEIKCTCGGWLEQRNGKFGAYFNCLKCGNINFQKGMEMKKITMTEKPVSVIVDKPKIERSFESNYNNKYSEKKERKEITVTSHDVEYFD